MPLRTALVLLAEFDPRGLLLPELPGPVLRKADAHRLSRAILRDCVEKAHQSAGLEPIVSYFPPDRRGEVEEACASLEVWLEPASGPTPGARAAEIVHQLLAERAFQALVGFTPRLPHIPRQKLYDFAHRIGGPSHAVLAAPPGDPRDLFALKGEVPAGFARIFDSPGGAEALGVFFAGSRLARVPGVAPLRTEDDLAHIIFDLRADLASRRVSGHDVPMHTLEVVRQLGLFPALAGGDRVVLRRSAAPAD